MTSQDRDDDIDRDVPPAPWYNRTSAVVGASVAGLAAIAVLVTSVSFVARQFNEPEQAPINFVDPAFTTTETSAPTATTTGTITSTRPPITSDINPDLPPPGAESPDTESPESPNPSPNSRPPRTREPDVGDESETSTTRNRPRTNVTRTLYPAP